MKTKNEKFVNNELRLIKITEETNWIMAKTANSLIKK
jgi:hypothetical protein